MKTPQATRVNLKRNTSWRERTWLKEPWRYSKQIRPTRLCISALPAHSDVVYWNCLTKNPDAFSSCAGTRDVRASKSRFFLQILMGAAAKTCRMPRMMILLLLILPQCRWWYIQNVKKFSILLLFFPLFLSVLICTEEDMGHWEKKELWLFSKFWE